MFNVKFDKDDKLKGRKSEINKSILKNKAVFNQDKDYFTCNHDEIN